MKNAVRHTPNTKGRTGKRNAWSEQECIVVIMAYMELLKVQREEGEIPHGMKARLRKKALPQLNNRSAGSYEAKMQNVSTFRHEYGLEIVQGYKALPGAQNLLGQLLVNYDDEFAAVAEFSDG